MANLDLERTVPVPVRCKTEHAKTTESHVPVVAPPQLSRPVESSTAIVAVFYGPLLEWNTRKLFLEANHKHAGWATQLNINTMTPEILVSARRNLFKHVLIHRASENNNEQSSRVRKNVLIAFISLSVAHIFTYKHRSMFQYESKKEWKKNDIIRVKSNCWISASLRPSSVRPRNIRSWPSICSSSVIVKLVVGPATHYWTCSSTK